MANVTIGFGLALAALGLGGYFATGRTSLTALIPLAIGLLLVLCGVLATRESLRKHAMHAAAVLGLLGFVGTAVRALPQLPRLLGGEAIPHRAAVLDQLLMMVVSGLFLALCIRSFVAARRARAPAA